MRPWKARSKTTTAGRPVAARAILTAFSTASAPELTSSDFASAVAGPELGQPAADLDVGLVHPDHEALVEEAVGLLVDRADDVLGAVAEVLAGDAAAEVDELPPVGVPDACAPARSTTSRGVETPRETYRSRASSTRWLALAPSSTDMGARDYGCAIRGLQGVARNALRGIAR